MTWYEETRFRENDETLALREVQYLHITSRPLLNLSLSTNFVFHRLQPPNYQKGRRQKRILENMHACAGKSQNWLS